MKFLICDDSRFVLNMLIKSIEKNFPDCEMSTAVDGESALHLYKQESPDIIITDLLMPGINGQEFVKQVRSENRDIIIIVLTADIQKATWNEMQNYHVTSFINKPLNDEKMDYLVDLIKEASNA